MITFDVVWTVFVDAQFLRACHLREYRTRNWGVGECQHARRNDEGLGRINHFDARGILRFRHRESGGFVRRFVNSGGGGGEGGDVEENWV